MGIISPTVRGLKTTKLHKCVVFVLACMVISFLSHMSVEQMRALL